MNLSHPFTMAILGSCGSGKSYTCKYLIQTNSDKFDYCFIITSTGFNGQYDFLKQLRGGHIILNTLNFDKKISFIMRKQKNYREKGIKSNILIVFDDVMGCIKSSKKFNQLISTFRHYNISIIFISQYACGISTELRELVYYALIFNQSTERSLKAVHQSYYMDMSYNEFQKTFNKKLEKKHSFEFINRLDKTKKVLMCP